MLRAPMGRNMRVRGGRVLWALQWTPIGPVLAAILSAATPPALAQDPEAWHALRLPSLCMDAQGAARLPRLEHGIHLRLTAARELAPEELAPRPVLPVPALLELLREDARRSGSVLRLSSSAPPLLAQGPAASIDALRALLAELEAASAALFVDVEVTMKVPLSPGGQTQPLKPAMR
jgi:hypothetical protein